MGYICYEDFRVTANNLPLVKRPFFGIRCMCAWKWINRVMRSHYFPASWFSTSEILFGLRVNGTGGGGGGGGFS